MYEPSFGSPAQGSSPAYVRKGGVNRPSTNLAVDRAARFDAVSNNTSGKPINYAGKVEAQYGMFANASNAINQNKAALQDKYIGDALVEAFQ